MSREANQVADASTSALRANTAPSVRSTSEFSQAGPLPRKVGEIGYDHTLHVTPDPRHANSNNEAVPLGPHPAERNRERPTPDNRSSYTSLSADGSTREPTLSHSRTETTSTASSTDQPTSLPQDRRLPLISQPAESSTSLATNATSISTIKRFTRKISPSPKPSKHLLGMAPRTLLKFLLLFVFLTGICLSWAFATKSNAEGHGTLFGGSNSNGGMNAAVFVHVAFAVIALTTLLFIERTIFRLRAERFSYLHPEVGLPTRNYRFPGNSGPPGLSFAPWQRPSLPTYAAALRAAPTATGDVEDQEVARMVALGRGDVPPLYGNTRGSTLLMFGPLTNRPFSNSSQRSSRSRGVPPDGETSRPVSYGQSQQIEDALRAQKLEETLSRLEANPPNSRG